MKPFIANYYCLAQERGLVAPWVTKVPAVQALQKQGRFEFSSAITIFSGENGVGKSTLLEGIAVSCGFNDYGGPFGAQLLSQVNPLWALAAVRKGSRPMDGYFMRAESHFSVATEFRNSAPGVVNLHKMSHGESVLQIVQESFHGNGLYLLDEPESGLSMIRQLTLLAELHQIAAAGAQVIMATHSPVLLAIPGADIWEFSAGGEVYRTAGVEETIPFRALAEFLADPAEISDFMLDRFSE